LERHAKVSNTTSRSSEVEPRSQPGSHLKVVRNGEFVVEIRCLRNVADFLEDGAWILSRIVSEDTDIATSRSFVTHPSSDERGFSRRVWAHESDYAACT
jgi:hypothetical protein